MKRLLLLCILMVASGVALGPGLASRDTLVKLATLVPEGSVWDKAYRRMGEDWKQATNGRITLRMYPSGVQGDEVDVIRKIKFGQLNAAFFSISGLGDIDPAFKMFEIPMFLESHAEAMHVLSEVTPDLERRLDERGYVRLGWGHCGWIHFFSTRPVETPDDMRKVKQFSWGGDNKMADWWRENGFQPVGIAFTDIPLALQNGMIESVPAPPLHVLALQWFRSVPYMVDRGGVPYLGALLMSKSVWSRIPPPDQAKLMEICRATEKFLDVEVPRQEAQAIEEMKQRGLTVTQFKNESEWRALADSFAKRMKGSRIPADIFDRIQQVRDEYRRASGK